MLQPNVDGRCKSFDMLFDAMEWEVMQEESIGLKKCVTEEGNENAAFGDDSGICEVTQPWGVVESD